MIFLVNEDFQKYYQICSGKLGVVALSPDFLTSKAITVDTDKINKIILKMDVDFDDGNPVHAEIIYYKVTDTNTSSIQSNVWYNCSYLTNCLSLLGLGYKKETKLLNNFLAAGVAVLD